MSTLTATTTPAVEEIDRVEATLEALAVLNAQLAFAESVEGALDEDDYGDFALACDLAELARDTGTTPGCVAEQLAARRDALAADATVAVAGLEATLTAAGIPHDIRVDPSDPDGTWKVLVEGRVEIELLATGWRSITGRWVTGSREPLLVGETLD